MGLYEDAAERLQLQHNQSEPVEAGDHDRKPTCNCGRDPTACCVGRGEGAFITILGHIQYVCLKFQATCSFRPRDERALADRMKQNLNNHFSSSNSGGKKSSDTLPLFLPPLLCLHVACYYWYSLGAPAAHYLARIFIPCQTTESGG